MQKIYYFVSKVPARKRFQMEPKGNKKVVHQGSGHRAVVRLTNLDSLQQTGILRAVFKPERNEFLFRSDAS